MSLLTPWRFMIALVATGIIILGALTRRAELANEPSGLDGLIASLTEGTGRERMQALSGLVSSGRYAVPKLVSAAKSDPSNARPYLDALGEILLSDDAEVAELADNALVEMTDSNIPNLTSASQHVLVEHGVLRHTRALNALEALGAVRGTLNRNEPNYDAAYTVDLLILDQRWKGTDVDLALAGRLIKLGAVHIDRGSEVNPQVLAKLRQQFGRLTVRYRTTGCLGIYGTDAPYGVFLQSVVPGSPAEQAGLRQGDFIVRVDNLQRPSMTQLVEYLEKQTPGGRIQIAAQRSSGRRLLTKVALGTDFGTGTCACLSESTPTAASARLDAAR